MYLKTEPSIPQVEKSLYISWEMLYVGINARQHVKDLPESILRVNEGLTLSTWRQNGKSTHFMSSGKTEESVLWSHNKTNFIIYAVCLVLVVIPHCGTLWFPTVAPHCGAIPQKGCSYPIFVR